MYLIILNCVFLTCQILGEILYCIFTDTLSQKLNAWNVLLTSEVGISLLIKFTTYIGIYTCNNWQFLFRCMNQRKFPPIFLISLKTRLLKEAAPRPRLKAKKGLKSFLAVAVSSSPDLDFFLFVRGDCLLEGHCTRQSGVMNKWMVNCAWKKNLNVETLSRRLLKRQNRNIFLKAFTQLSKTHT